MAILEIAQRKLKGDPALVKEVGEKITPGMFAALAKAGVTNALGGFLVSEDDKDVSGEYRELFLMEWPTIEHFLTFVTSPELREQGAKMAPYADGPTSLKVFDAKRTDTNGTADTVSALFASADNNDNKTVVLEYLVVKFKEPMPNNELSEMRVDEMEDIFQTKLLFGPVEAVGVVGTTRNLEDGEIGVMSVYASDADLQTARESKSRQQFLSNVALTVATTSLVAHVKKIIPLPLAE